MHGPESGPSYILTIRDTWCGTKRNLVTVIPRSVEIVSVQLIIAGGVCRRWHRVRVRTRITTGLDSLSNRQGRYRKKGLDQGDTSARICALSENISSCLRRSSLVSSQGSTNLTAPSDAFVADRRTAPTTTQRCALCATSDAWARRSGIHLRLHVHVCFLKFLRIAVVGGGVGTFSGAISLGSLHTRRASAVCSPWPRRAG